MIIETIQNFEVILFTYIYETFSIKAEDINIKYRITMAKQKKN